ncbi:hypothetical protein IX39_05725 [Chryseobacterium formosense]|uniref:Secretion system C-terminal sorting domain-containing protein n=1 Tax=Chryseobacterium formosense TaxID=236814 RepID=A0A085Z6U4_9FLAO|nr:hypothetical protein [Chryseobacterium formosense]KFF00158.1 hypothetical protein IX39_05725 [Chryseobacterium formosense]SFT62555.1 Por secretion system C-terminal sorting domain-containing protein [Chryseobacterium formosense]
MKLNLLFNKITFIFIFISQLVFSQDFNTQADFSNFKVSYVGSDQYIHYNYDVQGKYRGYNLAMYYNVVSNNTRIFTNSVFDDSNYDPIYYPTSTTIDTWNLIWDDYSKVKNAVKYILVIKTWPVYNDDGSILIPELTKTLGYTAPTTTPNLTITTFQVYSSSSGIKIFDSNTSSNGGPQLQKNASYKFLVTVTKTGNAAINNLRFDLSQYDALQGTYPSVSPKAVKTQYLNIGQTQNSAIVETETTIADFGSNSFIGIAFHLDKDNLIPETNENDNIKLLAAGYHGKMANITDQVDVDVYDMNGNLLKKLKTTSEDTDFVKVKSQLGSGKYILRSNEKSRQVLIK